MNELARVVYNMVAGTQDPDQATHLSQPEQATLEDLQALLRLPPRTLADLLSQRQSPEDWMKAPSTPEPARP
jgi:hypothetical protein